jgi:hypothetical protein
VNEKVLEKVDQFLDCELLRVFENTRTNCFSNNDNTKGLLTKWSVLYSLTLLPSLALKNRWELFYP